MNELDQTEWQTNRIAKKVKEIKNHPLNIPKEKETKYLLWKKHIVLPKQRVNTKTAFFNSKINFSLTIIVIFYVS